MPEVMCHVLLRMREAVDGELCLLEMLEVMRCVLLCLPEVSEVMRSVPMLDVQDVPKVMLLCLPEVSEAMRCVLICMLEAVEVLDVTGCVPCWTCRR